MNDNGLHNIVIYRSSEARWLRHSADWIQALDPERARLWRWLSEELDAAERRKHIAPARRQRVNQANDYH